MLPAFKKNNSANKRLTKKFYVITLVFVSILTAYFITILLINLNDPNATPDTINRIKETEHNPKSIKNAIGKRLKAVSGGDKNPINVQNVEYLENMNIPPDYIKNMTNNNASSAITKYIASNKSASPSQEKIKNPNSLLSMIGENVRSSDNRHAGKIQDIFFHTGTGIIKAVIIKENGDIEDQNSKAMHFSSIKKENNQLVIDIPEEALEEKIIFDYQNFDNNEYISLNSFRNMKIYDDEGKETATVYSVSSQANTINKITFELLPSLTAGGSPITFKLPYVDVGIAKQESELIIHLTQEQTEQLAKLLFQE